MAGATANSGVQACKKAEVDYSESNAKPLNPNDSNAVYGNSKVYKPYANSRPSYAPGQVEQVWENAKDSYGKVYDPSGAEIHRDTTQPRNGQWDMGHIPGQKYHDIHQKYMDGLMTKEEFLEWYRNPDNYRPELPSTNRGGKYE